MKIIIFFLLAALCKAEYEDRSIVNDNDNLNGEANLICLMPDGGAVCDFKCQLQEHTFGKCNNNKCECFDTSYPENFGMACPIYRGNTVCNSRCMMMGFSNGKCRKNNECVCYNTKQAKGFLCSMPNGNPTCNIRCQSMGFNKGQCDFVENECKCYNIQAGTFERTTRDLTCREGGNKDCNKQCRDLGWGIGQCLYGDCRCLN